jgi:hypothetical protein
VDSGGAKCQKTALHWSNKVYDMLWREALKAKRVAMKGDTPALAGGQLETAIEADLLADAKGRIARMSSRLATKTGAACAPSELAGPIGDLFAGRCAAPADAATLATCADEAAHCRFCTSLNAFDGLALDCDAFDDEIDNLSCP